LLIDSSAEFLTAYDLTYLQLLHTHMSDTSLSKRIRRKYASAWGMIGKRNGALMKIYERSGFDPRAISDFDWSDAMGRVGTDKGFHG
jgi:hypothetical protein